MNTKTQINHGGQAAEEDTPQAAADAAQRAVAGLQRAALVGSAELTLNFRTKMTGYQSLSQIHKDQNYVQKSPVDM